MYHLQHNEESSSNMTRAVGFAVSIPDWESVPTGIVSGRSENDPISR
jgi:hypothetical protein